MQPSDIKTPLFLYISFTKREYICKTFNMWINSFDIYFEDKSILWLMINENFNMLQKVSVPQLEWLIIMSHWGMHL